jgi:NAD(P)-dependent dehydrogenase (short-subunit alcohol dehydrogenase family)
VSAPKRSALVTGANRGLGLAVARALGLRGLAVILTGRDAEAAAVAARALCGEGLAVRAETLDVADAAAIRACAASLAAAGVPVDVLVNNAAVEPPGDALAVTDEDLRTATATNFLGAWLTCRAFLPAMIERGYGRVVNVTSDFGSFGLGLEGPAAYAVSKAALNAATVKLAAAIPAGVDVKVNALNPGWLRTRMGGAEATKSPEEGADTVVWLATLPADGPQGGFFQERVPIPW